MILRKMSVNRLTIDMHDTYTGDSERGNEALNAAPKPLTTLPIQKTEPNTLPRMVNQLAQPLVTIRVEHGYPPDYAVDEVRNEVPLHGTAVELAAYVVQNADSHMTGDRPE